MTPGQLATACNLDLEQVGAIMVEGSEAFVEVRYEFARHARFALDRIGPTRLLQWSWQWLKLNIGRNHGLTIGQLRKLMLTVDAAPLGRLHVNNTHTLVGLHDVKLQPILAKLATTRQRARIPRLRPQLKSASAAQLETCMTLGMACVMPSHHAPCS